MRPEIVKPVILFPKEHEDRIDTWILQANDLLSLPWTADSGEIRVVRPCCRVFPGLERAISVEEALELADLYRPYWDVVVSNGGERVIRWNGRIRQGGRTLSADPDVVLMFSLPRSEPEPKPRNWQAWVLAAGILAAGILTATLLHFYR